MMIGEMILMILLIGLLIIIVGGLIYAGFRTAIESIKEDGDYIRLITVVSSISALIIMIIAIILIQLGI